MRSKMLKITVLTFMVLFQFISPFQINIEMPSTDYRNYKAASTINSHIIISDKT